MIINTNKDQSGAKFAALTGITSDDQARLKSLGEAYGKAQDAGTRASLHSQAEAIRAQYGYSGGADGSEYIESPYMAALKAQKQQLDARQNEIDAMVGELRNMYSPQSNNIYSEALAAQKAANDAAVKQAVGRLNNQRLGTDTSYGDMFKQLYLDKMKNRKDIDQRLAFAGQTGGQAESTLLGLNTDYADALRRGLQSKTGALNDIDLAISEAQLTGDINNANAAAESATARANKYSEFLQNLISRYDGLNERTVARAAEESAQRKSYAYQTAMEVLRSGNMASDELLYTAGISKSDAQSIAKQAVARKSGTYGAYGASKYTEAQAGAAYESFMAGDRSPEVISILESYYGVPIKTIAERFGVSLDNSRYIANPIEYTQKTGNYQAVKSDIEEIYRAQGRDAALSYLREVYKQGGVLNQIDYETLFKMIRNSKE